MTLTDAVDVNAMDYLQVEAKLLGWLEGGDAPAAADFVQHLDIQAEMLVGAGLHAEAVAMMGRLDRLVHRLATDECSELTAETRGYMRATLDRLDRHIAVMDQQRHVRASEVEAVGVRERVLRVLVSEPLRSGEIAERLGISPTAVSRALRELRGAGHVERVTNLDGGDGRTRRYVAAVDVARTAVPAR